MKVVPIIKWKKNENTFFAPYFRTIRKSYRKIVETEGKIDTS